MSSEIKFLFLISTIINSVFICGNEATKVAVAVISIQEKSLQLKLLQKKIFEKN